MKTFISREKPFLLFEYPVMPKWNDEFYSNTSLRFNPGIDVLIKFEIPPSIDILDSQQMKPNALQHHKERGENSHGVKYESFFLKGSERKGYEFSKGENKVFVLTLGSYLEDGLDGEKINKSMRESFDFLLADKLTESQLQKIIENSPSSQLFKDPQKPSAKPLPLEVSQRGDYYRVSIKGRRGAPVVHLLKKDLSVEYIPTR